MVGNILPRKELLKLQGSGAYQPHDEGRYLGPSSLLDGFRIFLDCDSG
jgi:hypothetical protein